MKYVFVDESGDIGLNNRASKYYVLACLESDISTDFKTCLKRVRQRLGKNKKNIPEFKFSKSSNDVRDIFFREILKENWRYSVIVVDKTNAGELKSLYEYIPLLIKEIIPLNTTSTTIIVDKFLKGSALERFNASLRKELRSLAEQNKIWPQIEVRHLRSENEAGLQVVDFIAGSVYMKYSRGNSFFYDLIKPREIILKEISVSNLQTCSLKNIASFSENTFEGSSYKISLRELPASVGR